MNEIEAVLSEVPLFANLPIEELKHLAGTLRAVEFAPGAVLFREGEQGDHFYVIFAGQIEIIRALGTVDERLVAVRGPGEFVGELSLINQTGRRTASVRAANQARLLEMTRSDFDALLHRRPTLAYEMVRVLGMRLTASHDHAMHDLQAKNRQLQRAYEELKAAQAQIIEKEKLEQELQVAHQIQMSLLPRTLPNLAGFEFGAHIVPMSAVGGDFFDFIPLDAETLGVAVGDVSGHGVPAALFMALTMALLRAAACYECAPGDVLRRVNRQLLQLNHEGMFVTLLYGVLDRRTRRFTFVRAGHNPPLLCTAAGMVSEPELLRGQLVGVLNEPIFDEQTVDLMPGSKLLIYTDGVVEASDAHHRQYGEERLSSLVGANARASAQELCDRVWEAVKAYSDTVEQSDDITVICMQALSWAGD